MSRLQLAIEQIVFARKYTIGLLDQTPTAEWFRQPLDEFHPPLATKNYKFLRPGLETTFYDAKCLQVIDPFGNRIRFNEDLKPRKKT
jgi:hypothetical protein